MKKNLENRPYGAIAERIMWHRNLVGLTQVEYAQSIGVKRETLNNWESGNYSISMSGARAIRKTYGLSLDFIAEGISDALDMTLRKALIESPLVKKSK